MIGCMQGNRSGVCRRHIGRDGQLRQSGLLRPKCYANSVNAFRSLRTRAGSRLGYSSGNFARLIHMLRKPTETPASTSQRFEEKKVTSPVLHPKPCVTRE